MKNDQTNINSNEGNGEINSSTKAGGSKRGILVCKTNGKIPVLNSFSVIFKLQHSIFLESLGIVTYFFYQIHIWGVCFDRCSGNTL